jgi:Flp pilus assembly pilin Flp
LNRLTEERAMMIKLPMRRAARLISDTRGSAPFEYLIISAVLAVAVLGSAHLFGGRVIAAGQNIVAVFNTNRFDAIATGSVEERKRPRIESTSAPQKRTQPVAPSGGKLDRTPGQSIDINVHEAPLRRSY